MHRFVLSILFAKMKCDLGACEFIAQVKCVAGVDWNLRLEGWGISANAGSCGSCCGLFKQPKHIRSMPVAVAIHQMQLTRFCEDTKVGIGECCRELLQ